MRVSFAWTIPLNAHKIADTQAKTDTGHASLHAQANPSQMEVCLQGDNKKIRAVFHKAHLQLNWVNILSSHTRKENNSVVPGDLPISVIFDNKITKVSNNMCINNRALPSL